MVVAVFVAAMLASPQTRAAVMPSDADAERVLAADDGDPSRDAVVVDLPPLAFAIAGHPRGMLASTFAYADRATSVAREGPRARGPP